MAQHTHTSIQGRVPDDTEHEDTADEGVTDREPLLHDVQRDEDENHPKPWESSRKSRIPMIVYLIFLMVSLEFEESVQAVPTVRLYESAICQQYYHGPVEESRCKTRPIQQKLAQIRGWQGLFDALPTLILSIPFGYMSDRKGRRLILFLSELGEICCLGWILMTCLLWEKVPIYVVWINSLFRLIGGGPNVSFATLLAMAADVSTPQTRSRTFYIVFCSMLCVGAAGPRIASVALEHSLWLPYLFCAVGLAASFPVLYWMPETLPDTSTKQPGSLELSISAEDSETTLKDKITSVLHVYQLVLKDRRMLAALTCVFLAQFRTVGIDILLPYASFKFNWPLSKTAVLITVIYSVNIAVFLVILPFGAIGLKRITALPTTGVDLLIARCSLGLLASGAFVIGIANTVGLMFVGLSIFAAGFGARISMVSVMTDFFRKDYRARVYALLSIIEELTRLIGTPLIQTAWARGIEWGGDLLGFPFWILAVSFKSYPHITE
ncbi:hypothetical protein AYL99_09077 [Fonsecaea erecta]|uniref:Major facilitator superfamily (MFS) profile domain-containing protein n=1 Tax=Fonsecaea erecta TaxID=1367422 RepID=A0A178ZD10_9EURO|nr:hypothetical protein AYL99_09077 [Fonsecaea erecta]OAP56965.1 hypothetical protein AYL99_09077 [Fonsecaea erecta]